MPDIEDVSAKLMNEESTNDTDKPLHNNMGNYVMLVCSSCDKRYKKALEFKRNTESYTKKDLAQSVIDRSLRMAIEIVGTTDEKIFTTIIVTIKPWK